MSEVEHSAKPPSLEEENQGLDYKDWKGIETMESMCMRCGGTGTTRFMLHKIPFFRELIIASFLCNECGERNNEVTFGGEIQLQGSKYSLTLTQSEDMNRQIIKSDSASILIPSLDFEIPAMTQKGEITTIEGVLRTAAKNLSFDQPLRRIDQPEVYSKVNEIIDALEAMADGNKFPFQLILDDPAGNSFIENPYAPKSDPHLMLAHYDRTAEEDARLGIDHSKGVYKPEDKLVEQYAAGEKQFGAELSHHEPESASDFENGRLGKNEAVTIPSMCPNCGQMGDSHTAITDIPHFKEVIIMAFDCQHCGFRTNEVKGGGAVPTFGTEVQLKVESDADMKRDFLKSDTAMLIIPELDLELQVGTLGGMFTTVEGILQKIHANLGENSPFVYGDSKVLHHSNDPSISEGKHKFEHFLDELALYANGKKFPFTLIVRDPLGNSFISAPLGSFLPPEADKNLKLIDYERSFEENEELGLNDINTKDFETGVDYNDAAAGPVLPDRLTQHYEKKPDHPTFFAKGTNVNDTTVGGSCLKEFQVDDSHILNHQSSGVPENVQPILEAEEYCTPPEGFVAERIANPKAGILPVVNQTSLGRNLGNDDDFDFIPREEFYGPKHGYVFRLGSKGVGYYEDKTK